MSPAKRRLIEVALPLADISRASQADKQRKIGTIKNLHKWFAPMPTPALRALIFAALVSDPAEDSERAELLDLVRRLVPANGTAPSETVLAEAQHRIALEWPSLPVLIDPFAGGGSTLVEGQRLGLQVVGCDLNPVAALITRTLVQTVPRVADEEPLHPDSHRGRIITRQYDALANDVRHYADLIQSQVSRKVSDLYPNVPGGQVIAWLWARTVPCPNPSCRRPIPLYGSPWLSKLRGREAFLVPVVESETIRFEIGEGSGSPPAATKQSGRATFRCQGCGTGVGEKEIRGAGIAGKMRRQALATCLDTPSGRRFRAESSALLVDDANRDSEVDELEIGDNTRDFRTPLYGLLNHRDLHTTRQQAMLRAFAQAIAEIPDRIRKDGGSDNRAVAVATMLGLALGRLVQASSSLVRWRLRDGPPKAEPAFGTQAIPMLWDFAETNPFGDSVGSWRQVVESALSALPALPQRVRPGVVTAHDARSAGDLVPSGHALLVTDPPYFGQINYADLSDHFYPWLRLALRDCHPDLFGTIATPKSAELVANPVRHGGKDAARDYFIAGFTDVLSSLKTASHPDVPLLVVYAHKQDERERDGVYSTAWESLLEAVLAAGLGIEGTWPIEAATRNRQVGQSANALASYIVMVCRPRAENLAATTRNAFIRSLRESLPRSLSALQQASIAPIDLAQAAIGPGMAVFTRYRQVVEADGSAMTVRTALALINSALDEVLTEQEGDFDADTRFCLKWFSQFGWNETESGTADTLTRATNTSVDGLVRGGIFRSRAGRARLLRPDEMAEGWDPLTDERVSVWETVVRLAGALDKRGAGEAARLMSLAAQRIDLDAAKELAYLLYSVCEKKGWTESALLFNGLGTLWSDLSAAARAGGPRIPPPAQGVLEFEDDTEE